MRRGHLANNAGVRGHSCGTLFARTGAIYVVRVASIQNNQNWRGDGEWPILERVTIYPNGVIVSRGII